MKRGVAARGRCISAIKLINDPPFGDDSRSAAGSSGFGQSLCMFLRGAGSMGVELAGGEALKACARAGAAPTTAVVIADTSAALSSDVTVEQAGREALTACAGAAAAWTRAELEPPPPFPHLPR